MRSLVQNQRTLLAMVSPLFPPVDQGGPGGIYREGTAGPMRAPEHALGRRWGRRQYSRCHLRLEAILGMCAIAKWLIVTSAAATQGDKFPPRCTKRGTASVAQFDIAFDAQWTIISDRDFSRHAHLPSLGVHLTGNTTDIDKEGRALASSLSRSTISQIVPHQAVKFASGHIVSSV